MSWNTTKHARKRQELYVIARHAHAVYSRALDDLSEALHADTDEERAVVRGCVEAGCIRDAGEIADQLEDMAEIDAEAAA